MKWESRLAALEWAAGDEVDGDDRRAEFHALGDRRLGETLALIPAPFQQAVADAIRTRSPESEILREWLDAPFAPGSPTPASDFRFPVDLVKFLLAAPRMFWIGHSCNVCGLLVPVFLTCQSDRNPPPSLRPFPTCPACGGVTGYS